MGAGMVWILGHGDQEREVQWLGLMMGGVMELQGLRDGQDWTWSKPKMQHGLQISLCPQGVCGNARKKVFVKFWNILWWISFIYP
jgi:hypothetical protein